MFLGCGRGKKEESNDIRVYTRISLKGQMSKVSACEIIVFHCMPINYHFLYCFGNIVDFSLHFKSTHCQHLHGYTSKKCTILECQQHFNSL